MLWKLTDDDWDQVLAVHAGGTFRFTGACVPHFRALDIASEHFAPHNKMSDAREPAMRSDGTVDTIEEIGQALQVFAHAGLTAAQFDEDLAACSCR